MSPADLSLRFAFLGIERVDFRSRVDLRLADPSIEFRHFFLPLDLLGQEFIPLRRFFRLGRRFPPASHPTPVGRSSARAGGSRSPRLHPSERRPFADRNIPSAKSARRHSSPCRSSRPASRTLGGSRADPPHFFFERGLGLRRGVARLGHDCFLWRGVIRVQPLIRDPRLFPPLLFRLVRVNIRVRPLSARPSAFHKSLFACRLPPSRCWWLSSRR